jgi:hypothetical protein
MPDLDAFLQPAERNLNNALRQFEEASSVQEREFTALKLQATIFQYDVCCEMASILRNGHQGFAASVALKGLVLRLFEYNLALNKNFIPRMLHLAQSRNIPVDRTAISIRRREWKAEFKRLEEWADVRNLAAGHYGHDLEAQFAHLKGLSQSEVMPVARAFLSFNMSLLALLRDAGLGPETVVDRTVGPNSSR